MCLKNRLGLAVAAGGIYTWLACAIVCPSVRGDESSSRSQQNDQSATQQSQPAPIQLSGTGRQASNKFNLQPGLCILDVSHNGDDNFIVRVLDRNGKEIDTVFNEIGKFNGQRGFNVPNGGQALLDVQANGNWKAKLTQPRADNTAQSAPTSFQGNGCQATPFVKLDKGLTVFKLNHQGERRFKVTLLDQTGKPVEYLVNTLGPNESSKPVSIEEPGVYFLNVSADGNWNIDLQ